MNLPSSKPPVILTLPGLGNSGPSHWQTYWEALRPGIRRVEFGMWNEPRRNPWVTKLEQSVRVADAPVILVAHSLGCLTAAWWASLASPAWGHPVAAALLVAPPFLEVEGFPILRKEFGRVPSATLPFPTIVVASHDDPYGSFDQIAGMAHDWGAQLIDAGAVGHINALSGLGAWREGLVLLDHLERLVETGEGISPHARLQDDYDRVAAEIAAEIAEANSASDTNSIDQKPL